MSTTVSKLLTYPNWLADRMGPLREHGVGLPDPARDGFANADLVGYPNNHNYVIDDRRLIPTFDLYWRTQIVEQLYSNPVVNLLDVGSCKGWFVLRAAQRGDCKRALGIDIYAPWIELSNRVASFQQISNASFRVAFLREVFERPEEFGAPFDNILILNAYHYLFWGSGMYPDHFANHEEILHGYMASAAIA